MDAPPDGSSPELLSRIICDIGYIIAVFDSEKRALHDHICNTRVVFQIAWGHESDFPCLHQMPGPACG